MYKDPYLILQIGADASEAEAEEAYQRLKAKYSEERFLPGEEGTAAARNLSALETAYAELKSSFESKKESKSYGSRLGAVEELIKANKIEQAQQRLDEIMDRDAEWHYLQSIVFYKKGWYSESKTQLEMAVSMEPSNLKYKDALGRLNVFTGGGKKQDGYSDNKYYRKADEQVNPNKGQYNQSKQNYGYEDRQMGGCGGPEGCCMQLVCADCCCECMGGDLIPCC